MSVRSDLSKLLNGCTIIASAPGRVDCGNVWDLKPLALPYEWLPPITINIAIELRTTVRLLPYAPGSAKVSSRAPSQPELAEKGTPGDASFTGPLGLLWAALSHFGVGGVHLQAQTDIPLRSGLGGSAALLVAAVGALSAAVARLGVVKRSLSAAEAGVLAYDIESSIHSCGLQDQLAAALGGANVWTWRFSYGSRPFQHKPLVPRSRYQELERHMALVFLGAPRFSSAIIDRWVSDFLAGTTRALWEETHACALSFQRAVQRGDWPGAAHALKSELAVRRRMTPEVVAKEAEPFISEAEGLGCGAIFTGAGAGGSLWAVGEEAAIRRLQSRWAKLAAAGDGALMLPCRIARRGLVVREQATH